MYLVLPLVVSSLVTSDKKEGLASICLGDVALPKRFLGFLEETTVRKIGHEKTIGLEKKAQGLVIGGCWSLSFGDPPASSEGTVQFHAEKANSCGSPPED